MIEVHPIEPKGRWIFCPLCDRTLYQFKFDRRTMWNGPCYMGGESVPLHDHLTPAQRDGFGWHAQLNPGRCSRCGDRLFRLCVKMMDADPSAGVETVFFLEDGDRGPAYNFRAVRDGAETGWIVTRYDTPQGPMLEHEFGPFADQDWIGPKGVTMGQRTSTGAFAREFLLERWDELRAMPKAIGLDPADVRAQVHHVPLSAKAQRVLWAAPETCPIMFPPPPTASAVVAYSSTYAEREEEAAYAELGRAMMKVLCSLRPDYPFDPVAIEPDRAFSLKLIMALAHALPPKGSGIKHAHQLLGKTESVLMEHHPLNVIGP